ncbi:amidohydrolase family protein [Erysipelothrix sp. HDW6C]|uniref:amidohydrolase family protein n=1 Tax=Erysipelothrix sp. HDW6C TaxID=2714930 RepID=UPI00140C5429|nr:amidohydrolase family protein [Erysipelothrix sp. HDW6C]QIK69416.1 amidohydrolase family protein [Erysipelothrix sp. HDW6C]
MKLSNYKPIPECVVKETSVNTPKFKVFDFHTHMGKLLLGDDYALRYETGAYVEKLKSMGVVGIVNLDGFWGHDTDAMNQKIAGYEDFIHTFMWIDTSIIDDPEFTSKTKAAILEGIGKGMVGIKMWKDISLGQIDQNGNYIRTDDPRLDIIYEMAAKYRLPVLIHIADPTAFFKPLNDTNERYEEISENPDWSFSDDKFMTFAELMEMQDRMIALHPETVFVIAHVGSYAENLEHVSERMRRYPNMYVDVSARIAELGRVPYSSRKFFLEFQDRILFGTDCTPLDVGAHHPIIYRMAETDDEYFPYSDEIVGGQGRWNIYGLNLPDEVLEKFYYKNAARILNLD